MSNALGGAGAAAPTGPRPDEPCCGQPLTLGWLCRQVRLSRDLRPTDIAELSGLSVATVTRLEAGSLPERDTFTAYASALCGDRGAGRIAPEHEAFLQAAFAAARGAPAAEEAFQAVTFHELVRPRGPRPLTRLLSRLAEHPFPAYIRDELFFLHAVNRGLHRLYGLAPGSPKLARWEYWHVLGSVFAPGSRVLLLHAGDQFVPSLVRYFARTALPLLFTRQMAALSAGLCALSPDGFSPWWRTVMSLLLPEPPDTLPRTLRLGGDLVQAAVGPVDSVSVETAPGYRATFTLTAWQPLSEATDTLLRRVAALGAQMGPLLAADYEAHGLLHVNDWPEMRAQR